MIYDDRNGVHDMKWAVRFSLAFSLLNAFLCVAEYTNPSKKNNIKILNLI